MSGFSYAGRDFSPYVQAELVEPAAHALEPRALAVPGRPGALLFGCELPPREVRLRLHLDAGSQMTAGELSRLRALLRAWLCAPGGGDLALPGEGALTWRDAVVTGVSDWDNLFEGGSCAVDFTCYDPVAYGAGRSCTGTELEVLGTWPTLPVMTLTAAAGSAVKVADDAGRFVLVERDLSAGDEVVMDFASESVTVGGEDASADVAVESAFFSLESAPFPLTHGVPFRHDAVNGERRRGWGNRHRSTPRSSSSRR